MWMRKFLGLLFALALVLGMVPAALASNNPNVKFKDVAEDDWSLPYIVELNAKGLMKGTGDGRFEPNAPLTRAQAVTVAIRLMGLEDEAQLLQRVTDAQLPFADRGSIAGWAKPYIAVAVDRDILPAAEDGLLRPEERATRLWVSVLLVRALGYDAEAQAKMTAELSFRDAEVIPASLRGYVAAAVDHELVQGFPDRTFQPNQPLTRAQAAALLSRTDRQLVELGRLRPNSLTGNLVRVDARSRTLTLLVQGRERQIPVAAAAVIFLEDRRASLTDLPAGAQLAIVIDRDGTALLIMARRPVAVDSKTEVRGKIASLVLPAQAAGGLGLIVVDPAAGANLTLPVAPAATITYQGRSIALSSLQVGDEVLVRVIAGVAISVQVEKRAVQPPQQREEEIRGIIQAVAEVSITFQPSLEIKTDKGLRTVRLAPAVVITHERTRLSLSDLRAGDQVWVRLVNDLAAEIKVEERTPEPIKLVRGVLQSVAAVSITFQSSIEVRTETGTLNLTVASDAKITRDGRAVDLNALCTGDVLTVKVVNGAAVAIIAEVPLRTTELDGTIIGINGKSITLRTRESKLRNLTLADDAVLVYGSRKLTAEQLYTGDRVALRVRGEVILYLEVEDRLVTHQ